MPNASIWIIRLSLLWMLAGAVSGACMHLSTGEVSWMPDFREVHIPAMIFGWMLSFTMGVAWWIFPRVNRNERQHDAPAWIMLGLFQSGLLLLIFVPSAKLVAHLMLFSGCAVIILSILKRVKKRGHTH